MKTIISAMLLFAQLNVFSQDSPSRIGDYVVGETTLSSFKSQITYKSTTIENNDHVSAFERAPNDDEKGNIWIHPVEVDYVTEFPTRKELLYLNDSTEAFFINYIDLGSYVVNNVFLYFFKDTLVKISYDGSPKVNTIILDKYKGKAVSLVKTKSKSDCLTKTKSGKSVDNLKIKSTFLDRKNNLYATVELNLIVSENCDLSQYVSVDIYDKARYSNFIDECTAFLQRKKAVHIEYLKGVKEFEKSKL